jgi:hypothetical protein
MNQCQNCGAVLQSIDSACAQCNAEPSSPILPKLSSLEALPEVENSKTLLSRPDFQNEFTLDKPTRNIFSTPVQREYKHYNQKPHYPLNSTVVTSPSYTVNERNKIPFSPITSPLHSHSHTDQSVSDFQKTVNMTPTQFPSPLASTSYAISTSHQATPTLSQDNTIPRTLFPNQYNSSEIIPQDYTSPHKQAYAEPMNHYNKDDLIDDFGEDFTEVRQLPSHEDHNQSIGSHTIDSELDDFDMLEFDDSMNATSIEDLSNLPNLPNHLQPTLSPPQMKLNSLTEVREMYEDYNNQPSQYPPQFVPQSPYALLKLASSPVLIPMQNKKALGSKHVLLQNTQMAIEHFTFIYQSNEWWIQSLNASTWIHINQAYILKINQSIRVGRTLFTLKPSKEFLSHHLPEYTNDLYADSMCMLIQNLKGDWKGCLPIDRDIIRVGRGQGDWIFHDPYMNYVEMSLQQKDDHVVIHNLQSRNGIWRPLLDNEVVQQGMLIEASKTLFQVIRKST